ITITSCPSSTDFQTCLVLTCLKMSMLCLGQLATRNIQTVLDHLSTLESIQQITAGSKLFTSRLQLGHDFFMVTSRCCQLLCCCLLNSFCFLSSLACFFECPMLLLCPFTCGMDGSSKHFLSCLIDLCNFLLKFARLFHFNSCPPTCIKVGAHSFERIG